MLVSLLIHGSAVAGDVWTSPRDGISLLERTESDQHIVAAYVELCADLHARATMYDEREQRTSTWAESVGAEVAINGAFFDYTDYDAIGVSIGAGETWPTAVDYEHYTAVAFASYGRAAIFDADVALPPVDQPWWTEMVPGDPLLVDDGVIVEEECYSHMCEPNPRTAVGLTADNETAILVAVDGRSSSADGMTRAELADLMVGLGAYRALNLDGGGSTTLWVDGLGVVNEPSDGSERVVASHLGFVASSDPTCCVREPVESATGVFADLADDAWSKPYAEALYAAGITSGCQAEPLLFCPTCVLDRATLAVFVARAMGLDPVPETSFTDVDPDAWYAGYVEAVAQHGITSGCAADRFCPDQLATRYEAAAFVWAGMGLAAATPTGQFTDLSDSQASVVEALADACVVSGCAGDAFCPDDEVTREQLAKLVAVGFSVPPYAPCIETDLDSPSESDPDETDTPSGEPSLPGSRSLLRRSGCSTAAGPTGAIAVGLLTLRRRRGAGWPRIG